MAVSREYLSRCSAETGHSVSTLEKVTRLGELAAAVSAHPLLGNALALKGGTALNLCLDGAPTRLSVDLDYNYVAHAGRERMLEDRPAIEEAVRTLATRLGYHVQQSADAFAGRKLYATYPSVTGGEDRVEVDLNYLWRCPLAGVRQATVWQPGDLDRPRVQMVSPLELCVGKTLAFLDRTAARDAWDVARFPKSVPDILNGELFRPLLVAFSAILPRPLREYSRDQLQTRLTADNVRDRLVPMLAHGGPVPDPEALLEDAWQIVAPLERLSAGEEEYLAACAGGHIRPECLFPNAREMAETVERHPVLLWKMENVRRYRETTDGRDG